MPQPEQTSRDARIEELEREHDRQNRGVDPAELSTGEDERRDRGHASQPARRTMPTTPPDSSLHLPLGESVPTSTVRDRPPTPAAHALRRLAAAATFAVCLLPRPAPPQPALPYASLAPPPAGGQPEPACGTPALVALQRASAFAPLGSNRFAHTGASDGQPLWYDQNPRLLHAAHTGGLALDNLLVLGDVETLNFERWSDRSGTVPETWHRTGTTAVEGRLISIFNPRWTAAELWDAVRARTRGFDSPYVNFGWLTVPSPDHDEGRAFGIVLNWTPLNLPPAQLTRIDADTQYASHVVNLVVPGFGDHRLSAGDYGYDLADAARRFYRHFKDDYESIAFVSRQLHLVPYSAFHLNVRNPIAGLGNLPVFDDSAAYGSAGVLRSVEFYPSARFAATSTSNHQIAQQWVDYWNWSAVAGGVERTGYQPETHTPLLYPGEVYAGAVLPAHLRVAAVADGAAYAVEHTPSPALYHPTTLYRMGLIGPESVPDLLVFESQGQFEGRNGTPPAAGTPVEGGVRAVHINDLMAEHGVRRGPVDPTWSRVTVVVSRDGLLSAEEMSYWNLFAARHAATEGVTSWRGTPSFFEATGGRMPLLTDVTPIRHRKIALEHEVARLPIDPREFRGVLLDEAVPAAITTGQTVTVSGTVTDTDADHHIACVRWLRGSSATEPIYECGAIRHDWFSIPYTFTDAAAGNYALAVFLISPDSVIEHARGRISGISVTRPAR